MRRAFAWVLVVSTVVFAAPVALREDTPFARKFKTVLKAELREGANFAGHFRFVEIGCGTSCRLLAVIDLETGAVFDLHRVLDTIFVAEDYGWPQQDFVQFTKDSDRLVLVGRLDEGEHAGRFEYRWSGTQLELQKFELVTDRKGPHREKCLSAKQAEVPDEAPLWIGKHLVVKVCHLPERSVEGMHEPIRDVVVLEREGRVVLEEVVKTPVTVGRVAGLQAEKSSERFISVAYDGDEFCRAVTVFDLKTRKATSISCTGDTLQCSVTAADACTAQIECRDEGGDGNPPSRRAPIQHVIGTPCGP